MRNRAKEKIAEIKQLLNKANLSIKDMEFLKLHKISYSNNFVMLIQEKHQTAEEFDSIVKTTKKIMQKIHKEPNIVTIRDGRNN